MEIHAGQSIGPYQVRSFLGQGAMGCVYLAHDPRLGRDVAVKVLPEEFTGDPERLRRFEQEARAIAQLGAPNIVQIFDVGTLEGMPYLVMELVEGPTGPSPSTGAISPG
jgi:serine/threonine protein kinase